mmetsp:Transcript_10728/g.27109  ORF Transcript_10728/g.27109 Transcript_10728/m.27109 type:complete len:312 (+) Transcript_10728:101-1036(+)
MPRRPSKLANCYVPLPLPAKEEKAKATTTTRPDGRCATHELRRLCLETSVISKAMGSSLVELGHTKVLAEVHIAAASTSSRNKSMHANNEATTDTGSLQCTVKYAPHIGINQVAQQSSSVLPLDGTNSNSSNNNNSTVQTISAGKLHQEILVRESDLSKRLTASLLPVMILEKYPKCTIVLSVTVLQDDGACLSAAITASSMALVDARVHVRDMVTSCTVAVVENNSNGTDDDDDDEQFVCLADPTQQETMNSRALICLAMTPNHKEVTLWSQSGRLSSQEASLAMELCRDGCRTMHKFMRESWITSMEKQ